MLKNTKGEVISSIDDWTRPKRDYQWKRGRSAMELARSWLHSGICRCPAELEALLNSHDLTANWNLIEGCPELVTSLPQRGEGRNHDLWLRGHAAGGRMTVCIEAKVDEPFGDTIGESIAKATRRSPDSGVPARTRSLLHVLTGTDIDPELAPWRDIRYQLLTASAGTVLQASRDGSSLAILVVHEFTGPEVDAALQTQNGLAFETFVHELFPGRLRQEGQLVGPKAIQLGDGVQSQIQLLVGKIRTEVS